MQASVGSIVGEDDGSPVPGPWLLAIVLSPWGDEVELAFQHIERELAGKDVKVECATHTVTKDMPEEALRAAGREFAREILSQLQGSERNRPQAGTGVEPASRLEELPGHY